MKRNHFLVTSVLFFAIIATGLTACSKKETSGTGSVADSSSKKASNRVLTIDSETIYGEKISNEIYKKNDFTLVNIMATWCGPCIREIPELQQIDAENNGFGVVGIVVDTYDEASGKNVPKAIEEAKNITNKTGAEYPFIIPTQTFLEQTLKKSAALLPMSFIVDKEGNIVKGPIAGAKTKEQWLDILNSVKTSLK